MSLENIQAGTNLQRVLAGNTSASNDPTQWKHDGTEQLIKGAELAAAGRTLGMSEEETLAAVSRQFRRQSRADDSVTERDVLRQMVQSAATTSADVGTPEIKGVGFADRDDEAFAFGEDVEYNNRYGITRADDEQPRVTSDNGYEMDEVGNIVRREASVDRPRIAGRVPSVRTGRDSRTGKPRAYTVSEDIDLGLAGAPAPKSALVDALARLQQGTDQYGYDAYPGSADIAGRLEADIAEDKGAEKSLARETVRRDSQRFSSEVEEANYYKAEAEALKKRRELFGPRGDGTIADRNLSREGRIIKMGERYSGEPTIVSADEAILGQVAQRVDGVYLDPETGLTVGPQGPELPPGYTGENMNAPQTAKDWMETTLERTLQGQRSTSDALPVDITRETTNFANKVRDYYHKQGIAQSTTIPPNIRSSEELQRVVDRVVAAAGNGLTRPDPENPGKSLPAGRNQVDGVMNALGMTLGEQRQFSNAMFHLEAARRSTVNQNPTGVYLQRSQIQGPEQVGTVSRQYDDDSGKYVSGATFGAGDPPSVARIPRGSTIGVRVPGEDKPKRRNIVEQLAKLEGEDAQRPFMGQVEGEKPRVNRMNRTGESSGVDAAIAVRKQAESRARGKEVDAGRTRENQVKAFLTQERENRDSVKREEQKEAVRSRTPANLRQAGRYSEADEDIPGIERKIQEQRQLRELEATKRAAEAQRPRRRF